jgi:hypothetical protein
MKQKIISREFIDREKGLIKAYYEDGSSVIYTVKVPEAAKEAAPVIKHPGGTSMRIRIVKAGNIAGLAKHLSHKLGGDPHFFTKCMACEEVADYPDDVKKRICADAHAIVTGIWPGEHGGENPEGRG